MGVSGSRAELRPLNRTPYFRLTAEVVITSRTICKGPLFRLSFRITQVPTLTGPYVDAFTLILGQ
jgi:hypothetical protein